jgi:hypothetical protein
MRFPSRKVALTALNQAIGEGVDLKRVYKCPFCKDWHLTHEEEKENG